MMLLLLPSCRDKSTEPVPSADGLIRTKMLLAGDDDSEIGNVTAWRFDGGVLKEILQPEQGSGGDLLVFSPQECKGTVYFIANARTLEALGTMTPGNSREEEFVKMIAHVDEMIGDGLLMTGKASLDSNPAGVLPVTMQRAVARIDIFTPEAEVEVLGVSVKGLYDAGYVIPQDSVSVPLDAASHEFARDYADGPLSNARETLLYVPEQNGNDGAIVAIEALLNGSLHRLRVRLPYELRRNNIYTVQVRGNGTGLTASVTHGDWQSGGVSGSQSQPSVFVDLDNSVLDDDVRLSLGRDTVFFPYTGGDWQLALHTVSDAVLSVEGHLPGVSVGVVDGVARLKVSSGLRLPGTTDGEIWINVSNAGVQTGKVTLIFDASPVRLDGMLVLDDAGVCDLGRYVDGELGTVEIPSGKVLTVDCGDDDEWMIAELADEGHDRHRYRIVGGWRPNDPKADGRRQEGLIVIEDIDGSNSEEYVVRRINWGLPVVKMGDTWWAKYNLRGDVRRFEDQITCTEDPAAGRDILDVLENISGDSLLVMMGDQYQAGFFEGLPLRHDGEAYYHEGMRPSGQNFGLLDPSLMAPDGYQVPDYDDYAWLSANDNHNLGGVGSRTYNNRFGETIRITIAERDIDFLVHDYGVVSFYVFENDGSRWALFGLGHQWNTAAGNIARMHLLLATYGNPDQTWVMEGYEAADRPGQNWLKFTPQNHIKTRTIRCVKTPVEYIY